VNRVVLIVDDEAEFSAALAKVLGRRGIDVHTAGTGEVALALLRSHAFPVVLLDVKMPGMDGLQVLTEIKRSRPATQVILMTGHLAPGEEERCSAGGAFAYLLKPYPTAQLVGVIEAAGQAAERAAAAPGSPAAPVAHRETP
jgi:two-component system, OmpR family, response regulator